MRRPTTRHRPDHLPRASCPDGLRQGQGWQRACRAGAERAKPLFLAQSLAFRPRERDFRPILVRSRFLDAFGRAPLKQIQKLL
jgi:hypothetical protein